MSSEHPVPPSDPAAGLVPPTPSGDVPQAAGEGPFPSSAEIGDAATVESAALPVGSPTEPESSAPATQPAAPPGTGSRPPAPEPPSAAASAPASGDPPT